VGVRCKPEARPPSRTSRTKAKTVPRRPGKAHSALAQARLQDPLSRNLLPDTRLMHRRPPSPYTADEFAAQATAVKWELAILAGGLTAYGFKNWGWGSVKFHAQNEGFFGENTSHGGMDKLGHAFSTMLIADVLNARIAGALGASDNAALTASFLAFGAMSLVEVADGFAKNHGFSYEDLVADAAGAIFSYLRNTIPGLRDKLDYRVQYLPSKGSTEDPVNDYMGQKYLLALKLSGFEQLQPTAFRFVELHVGYFARGYGETDAARGVPRQRNLYAGIGLNLNELLFASPAVRQSWPGNLASFMLERFQVPYTSINTNNAR
jgi:hypothetical protein